MSPPANTPRYAVIMSGPTSTTPSRLSSTPSRLVRRPWSTFCPSASTTVSASMVSNSPVGCGQPFSSSTMVSTLSACSSASLMVRNQLTTTPSSSASSDLEVVGGHLLAGAAIHDDGLRAEPLGGAGNVDRGVAAAVHDHPASKLKRCVVRLHAAQKAHGVEDLHGVGGGDVHLFRQVRPDGGEAGVEAARGQGRGYVVHSRIELERHAHIDDALHLRVHHVAGQTVLGDAEAHHPAGHRPGLADADLVAHQRQMIGGGQTAGTGSDDQHLGTA